MRNANLELLRVVREPNVPHPTRYWMHVATPPDGSALGICIASVSSGVVPCRGYDSDTGDGYPGTVTRAADGTPIQGALVRYWGQSNGIWAIAAQTHTSADGRHCVRLPPGEYRCQESLPISPDGAVGAVGAGDLASCPLVNVQSGFKVVWEDPDVAIQYEGVKDENGVSAAMREIEVSVVTEEWFGDWHREDGQEWNWMDVENTIKEAYTRITRGGGVLPCVTFSSGGAKWVRADLLASLARAGVNARDLGFSGARLVVAWRNFKTLMLAGTVSGIKHERANFQLSKVTARGGRLQSPPGVPHYLAEARIVCLNEAALHAGPGRAGKISVWNPRDSLGEDALWKRAPVLRLCGAPPPGTAKVE